MRAVGATPLLVEVQVSLGTMNLSVADDEAGALTTAYPPWAGSFMLAGADSTDGPNGEPPRRESAAPARKPRWRFRRGQSGRYDISCDPPEGMGRLPVQP